MNLTCKFVLLASVIAYSIPVSAQQCISTTSGGLGLSREEVCGGHNVTLPKGTNENGQNIVNNARAACQALIREFGSSRLDDCVKLFGNAYKKAEVPELFLVLAKELHSREAYQKAYSAYGRYCRSLMHKGRQAPCCTVANLKKLKTWLQSKQYFKVFLSVEPSSAGVFAKKIGKKRERKIRPRLAGYYCVHPDTRVLLIKQIGYITNNIALENKWGKPVQGQKIRLRRPAVEVAITSNVPNTAITDPDTKKIIARTPKNPGESIKVRVSPRGATSVCTLWAEAQGYSREEVSIDTADGEPNIAITLKPPPSAVIDVTSKEPETKFYLKSQETVAPTEGALRVIVGKQGYTLVAKKRGLPPVEIKLGEKAQTGSPYPVTIDLSASREAANKGLFLDLFVGLNLRDYGDDRLATTPGTEFGVRIGYFVKQWEHWGLLLQLSTVFSPVQDQSMEEEDWYHLLSLLGGAGVRYRPLSHAWLDFRLSLGALLITSIDLPKGSLFDGSSSDNPGSVALFAVRPEFGLGFNVWRTVTLGITVAVEFSPNTDSALSEEIGGISRMSIGGNVGWQF